MFMRVCFSILVLLAAAAAVADDVAGVRQPTVLVLGDSLSAAYGMSTEAGWVALLRKRLGEQGYDHQVVNASISGDTTQGGLARLPRALATHQPEVVILELGGNDGLRGLPLKVVRGNLQKMVQLATAADAHVVLTGIQIPPNYGPKYTAGFKGIYEQLGEHPQVTLVPRLMESVALDPQLMQADGVHPNAAAQPVLLAQIWPHLAGALGARSGVAGGGAADRQGSR